MARILLTVLAVLVTAFFSAVRAEDVSCPAMAEAQAACAEAVAGQNEAYHCQLKLSKDYYGKWSGGGEYREIRDRDGAWGPTHGFDCPSSMCTSRSPIDLNINGSTDFMSGAAAYACHDDCQYVMTDAKSWNNGSLVGAKTSGRGVPTGRVCGDAGVTAPPEAPPGPMCADSGVCYKHDDGGGKYCAQHADGSEICVPAPKGPTDPGGCQSSSGGTVCAGSPGAPTPPPPDPQKPDEGPTQKSDDTFSGYSGGAATGGSPGTGGTPQSDNVTTFYPPGAGNDPGSEPNDGDPGECDPASSGTSGGAGDCQDSNDDDDSASGGTTCGAPPQCSGNAISCAILYQQWRGRCEGEKLNKAFDPSGLPVQADDPDISSVIHEKTIGDGSAGGSVLDESGYGLTRSCPIHPFTFSLMGKAVDVDYTKVCDYLEIGRYLLLIIAYIYAAKILLGVN